MDQPIRKRLLRRETGGARFLTFSTYRRLPLFDDRAIAQLMVDALAHAQRCSALALHAWVVMPEHVHLLSSAQRGFMEREAPAALSPVISSIKQSVAQRAVRLWTAHDRSALDRLTTPQGRVRFWQHGGGFDRNVRDEQELTRTIHYIHHNPVERGLVERPEEWPWSSVAWWRGVRDGPVQCDYPATRDDWSSWTGYV